MSTVLTYGSPAHLILSCGEVMVSRHSNAAPVWVTIGRQVQTLLGEA